MGSSLILYSVSPDILSRKLSALYWKLKENEKQKVVSSCWLCREVGGTKRQAREWEADNRSVTKTCGGLPFA